MATKKPVIQVIGSLHLDFVTTVTKCPTAGETIRGSHFDVNAGGKGANQAAACGRAAFVSPGQQDVDVEMIGAVGSGDPYYKSLLQPALKVSGVGTAGVAEIEGQSTGSATIIVEEGGENRIIFVPGAGFVGNKDAKEVIARSNAGGRPPDIVLLQGEIPRDVVFAVVEHYNGSQDTRVVFNPAPVWPEGIPGRTLKGLAALVVNETECLLLVKSMSEEGYHMEQIERVEDLTEAVLNQIVSEFHGLLNIRTVIVTLGAKGVFYSQYLGSRGFFPAIKVDSVVDTTAAGDTFVGYFATELARSLARGEGEQTFDVAKACRRANSAAAKCVTRPGAMQSIPYGYEI